MHIAQSISMLSLLQNTLNLPRRTKRGIYLLLDTALVPICLVAVQALRYGMLVPTKALEGDLVSCSQKIGQ